MKHSIQEPENNFVPIKLTITIESEEELVDIHNRLNFGSTMALAPKGLFEMGKELLSIANKRQINLSPTSMVQITIRYPLK